MIYYDANYYHTPMSATLFFCTLFLFVLLCFFNRFPFFYRFLPFDELLARINSLVCPGLHLLFPPRVQCGALHGQTALFCCIGDVHPVSYAVSP